MTRQNDRRRLALAIPAAFAAPTAVASAGAFGYLALFVILATIVALSARTTLARHWSRLIIGTAATTLLGVASFLAWGTPSPTAILVIQLAWLAYVVSVAARLLYASIEPRIDAGS